MTQPPWVMKHKQRNSYLCRVAQGVNTTLLAQTTLSDFAGGLAVRLANVNATLEHFVIFLQFELSRGRDFEKCSSASAGK
jgi:hypothetical protein